MKTLTFLPQLERQTRRPLSDDSSRRDGSVSTQSAARSAPCQSCEKDLQRRAANGRSAHQRGKQRPRSRSELMMTYDADAHSAACRAWSGCGER